MLQGDRQRKGLTFLTYILDLTPPTRYINYFSGLLSGSIRMNSSPLFLHYVLVPVLPALEPGTGESAWDVLQGGLFPNPPTQHLSCALLPLQAFSPSSRSTSPCSLSTHPESSECCVPKLLLPWAPAPRFSSLPNTWASSSSHCT